MLTEHLLQLPNGSPTMSGLNNQVDTTEGSPRVVLINRFTMLVRVCLQCQLEVARLTCNNLFPLFSATGASFGTDTVSMTFTPLLHGQNGMNGKW